jgi:hypothetical protein
MFVVIRAKSRQVDFNPGSVTIQLFRSAVYLVALQACWRRNIQTLSLLPSKSTGYRTHGAQLVLHRCSRLNGTHGSMQLPIRFSFASPPCRSRHGDISRVSRLALGERLPGMLCERSLPSRVHTFYLKLNLKEGGLTESTCTIAVAVYVFNLSLSSSLVLDVCVCVCVCV